MKNIRILSRVPLEQAGASECSVAELERQQREDQRRGLAKQWIAQARGQNEPQNESV